MFLWQTLYHYQCCQDLTSTVALCGDVALSDHLLLWTNTHLSLIQANTHKQTHSCWINDLMSNEPVSSVCYQCDPGQVLWHHQHQRRGAARCHDRRSRNRNLQRVSMRVSSLIQRRENKEKQMHTCIWILQFEPSSHSFHDWMKFGSLWFWQSSCMMNEDSWNICFWKFLKQCNCTCAVEAWIYQKQTSQESF